MKIISRESARGLGLKRFFDGQPCKRGHISERSVINRACLACKRDDFRACSDTYILGLIQKQRREAARAEKARLRDERMTQRAANATTRKARNRELQKAWRIANRDRQRENIKRWKRANRDKVRGRKLKKRGSILDYLFKVQRGRCAYCRDPVVRRGAHIDHIVPRSAGGTNRRANLQLTCGTCNLSKGAYDPVVFAQSLGRLI